MFRVLCKSLLVAGVLSVTAAHGNPVPIFTFPDPNANAVQYGDFHSFSMPVLSSAAQGFTKSSAQNFNNSDPYFINTPNVIGEALVVGYGSGGNLDNQDLGLNGTVQDGLLFPNAAGSEVLDFSGVWSVSLSALRDYLTIDGIQYDLMAYFNNNQRDNTVESNNLWAKAVVTLTDTEGGAAPLVLNFNDPSSANADFVLSGGAVTLCFDEPNGPGNNATRVQVSCAGAHDSETVFEHNLGSNGVAYAITSMALNQLLRDGSSPYDMLSISIDFEALNNGFEALYLGAGCVNRVCERDEEVPEVVPEPATLGLLGVALLALATTRRRRIG